MHSAHRFCRLCAKPFDVSSLIHIFKNDIKSVKLDVLIGRYMPFPVTINDSLSQFICKLCFAHVIRWHRFLLICIKAQAQLMSMQEKSSGSRTVLPEKPAGIEDNRINSLQSRAQRVDLELPVAKPSQADNTVLKKKSNYCIARWCNNSNNMGIPFFRVPRDRERALQWLSAADRMDLAIKDVAYLYRCYLCATHFAKEMFANEHCKNLNRNAVPSIFKSRPLYAQKMNEASKKAEVYPKELQGVRLKNILPKSTQKSQETSVEGSLSSQQTSGSYAQLIRLVGEPQHKLENPLQEVIFVGDAVSSHSNIQIISLIPMAEDTSGAIQVMEVQETEGLDQSEVLATVTNSRLCESFSSTSTTEVLETPEERILGQQQGNSAFICDTFESETNYQDSNEIGQVEEPVREVAESVSENEQLSSSTLSINYNSALQVGSFNSNSDAVMMLEPVQKCNAENDNLAVLEVDNNNVDQHAAADSLGLHIMLPEESLTPNIAMGSSFSSENRSFIQDDLNFCSKESVNKDNITDCLENVVVSQDFLLMHSSSDHIEQGHDHGFRQDKNLNNLCCPIVRETTSETPNVYGERSMLAEASVRAIECTSPNHGLSIEGLINLDQFLDSGHLS